MNWLSEFIESQVGQFKQDVGRVGYVEAFSRAWYPAYQEAAVRSDLASGIPIKDVLYEFEKQSDDSLFEDVPVEQKWEAISLIADDLKNTKKERLDQFLTGLAFLIKKEDSFGKKHPEYYTDFCTWYEESPYDAPTIEKAINDLNIDPLLEKIDDIRKTKGYQYQYRQLLNLRKEFGKVQSCDQTGGVLQLGNYALFEFLEKNKPFPIRAAALSSIALITLVAAFR